MKIKEILSELQLAAGKNASVDFTPEVAEECENYQNFVSVLSSKKCKISFRWHRGISKQRCKRR